MHNTTQHKPPLSTSSSTYWAPAQMSYSTYTTSTATENLRVVNAHSKIKKEKKVFFFFSE